MDLADCNRRSRRSRPSCCFKTADRHFLDHRHRYVTHLFGMGRMVPLAASVSGHRSWQSLQRYTHIRQTGDKYEGWPWLKRLIAPPPC